MKYFFAAIREAVSPAIHGEERRDCFRIRTPRNDRLRKMYLSLPAERGNLKAFRFRRELLPNHPDY